MRIGLFLNVSKPVDDVVDQAQRIADGGFAAAAASQIFGYDTLTLYALVGSRVPGIELVTSVVPTWPRHPVMLAAQALTVQAAIGGRLTLGIGLSHKAVVENVWGIPFEKPVEHMRDYLSILQPVLHGEQVTYAGETLSATTFGPPEISTPAPKVLLAALAPRMLALAGELADGTTTWMTGPKTLEAHIIPTIRKAALDAGRPEPTVAASFPVCVTSDVDAARELAGRLFAVYGTLPSYQAVLEREGVAGPAGIPILGDETSVAAQVRHLADIGVTDLHAAPIGTPDEIRVTTELLASLAAG